MRSNFVDLVETLRSRAEQQTCGLAYSLLSFGKGGDESLTYGELDRRARALAATLQRRFEPGGRALLMYPAGLDFIVAYFGCLYAGLVAVPALPPQVRAKIPRLRGVVEDARATVGLSSGAILARFEGESGEPDLDLGVPLLDTTVFDDPTGWTPPDLDTDSLALLQYTSGSTGRPKGVMVSHGNLLANCDAMARIWSCNRDDVMVSWLPATHDLGLIFGILLPLYVGFPVHLMSPLSFLKRPLRWLEAISVHGGTISGAPNFAYDLCVAEAARQPRKPLDLGRWRVALNGAETVRMGTLDRFTEAFAPWGFEALTHAPGYGLAEATLMVSAVRAREASKGLPFDARQLGANRVLEGAATPGGMEQTVVSCGGFEGGTEVLVVDPESRRPCPADGIGEIWVAGASVAGGFWNRPEETRETFHAVLEENDGRRFLRTGDLGFLHDGELFVTGRLKELIIIRGVNFYPQDIERTVEEVHPGLRPHGGASFSVEAHGEERLVVVQELLRSEADDLAFDELLAEICEAVAKEHEIEAFAVVLVRQGSVGKTSSGKLQRRECRAQFLADELKVVASWRAEPWAQPAEARAPEPRPEAAGRRHRALLEDRLLDLASSVLQVVPEEIALDQPLSRYGMSSATALQLIGKIERAFDRELEEALLYEHPTISDLARRLEEGRRSATWEPETGGGRSAHGEPIAVVGMGLRLPGAADAESFWRLLEDGVEAIRPMPRERRSLLPVVAEGPLRGGYVDGVDLFDAEYFGIAPREAALMDPQQRILLEVTFDALGHAGIQGLAGSATGVFVGVSTRDYERIQSGTPSDTYSGSGNAASICANRLSYSLDLRGPSIAVDTACSSSLVAVHLACRSLRDGECNLALAGGVNLLLDPEVTAGFSQARMLAPDGRCKTFDASADGYVRSEGCGMVVLKRLSDARRDGDPVLAMIRGSAINQDGRSNGLTAPNRQAQVAVIRKALADAGVEAREIGCIEAHGTGTPLGDPIELDALQAAFGGAHTPESPCAVGSVKTNLGHLEAAAGIAGLLKAILSVRHRQLPPHLHLRDLNPRITLGEGLFIPTLPMPWPGGERPALAGVSSFGFGGTNAHVIVEGVADARTPQAPPAQEDRSHLFCLSAHTDASLRDLAGSYRRFLQEHPETPLADICHTVGAGRDHFPRRLALVARDLGGIERALAEVELGGPLDRGDGEGSEGGGRIEQGTAPVSRRPRIAFLFTGQGAQYPDMGRRLYETQPVFRQVLDRCAELLESRLESPLLEVIFPAPGEEDGRIHETLYTQLSLFAFEVGLVETLASWGVHPDGVIGHSIGEIAAACMAGVFSLSDALDLVFERARRMQSLPAGGVMATLFTSEAQARELAGAEPVSIAAVNSPENVVISGPAEAMARVEARCGEAGVRSRRLEVSHAFHSELMEPICADFRDRARRIAAEPPAIPLYSNLTGAVLDRAPDADYWARHLRSTVRFHDGLSALRNDGYDVLLEIGPRPVLTALAAETDGPPCWPTLRPGSQDWEVLLSVLARLYVCGVDLDWTALPGGEKGRRLAGLPVYAFERRRHWFRQPTEGPRLLRVREMEDDSETASHYWRLAGKHGVGAGSLSQVTGKQLLFRGSTGEAYFHFNRRGGSLVALDYVGSETAYEPLVHELLELCSHHGLEPLILETVAPRVEALQHLDFSTTRFGAWQDVEDIAGFQLSGRRMRRLRYMVQRYAGIGSCDTVEHTPGVDAALDREIAALVAAWAEHRGVGAPFVAFIQDAIIEASRPRPRRTFLVRRDGALEAAIVVVSSKKLGGYLMDMEFYRADVPMGCLELGIVQVIEALQAEGCSTFSLGLTPAARIEPHPGEDPEVRRYFAELRETGVLAGDSNLQFKNKFRPLTRPAFLCCPRGAGLERIDDFLYLMTDPLFSEDGEELVALEALRRPSREADHGAELVAGEELHPLLQRRLDLASRGPVFESVLSLDRPDWLADHRIFGVALLPATALIEMALTAGSWEAGEGVELAGLEILEPLPMRRGVSYTVQVLVTPGEDGELAVEVWGRPRTPGSEDWILHARGLTRRARPFTPAGELPALLERASGKMAAEELYAELAQAGFEYGPAFRGIDHLLLLDEDEVLGRVKPVEAAGGARYLVHPARLDACLHSVLPILRRRYGTVTVLPVGVEGFRVRPGALSGPAWVHARLVTEPGSELDKFAIALLDDGGELLAEAEGFLFRKIEESPAPRPEIPADLSETFYEPAWRPLPRARESRQPDRAHWLILSDRGEVGRALAEALAASGQPSSRAFLGTDGGLLGADGEPWSLDRLLGSLDPGTPLRIVHLWGLDLEPPAVASPLVQQEAVTRGSLRLLQELSASAPDREARVWMITEGAQPPSHRASEATVQQATLWGLGRTMARELPHHWGGLVDLPAADPRRAAQILLEELGPGGSEPEVAFAGDERMAPRLVPARLPSPRHTAFDGTGTVLITGGLGVLGLRVAEWLMGQGVRHLVLTSRRDAGGALRSEIAQRLAGAEVRIRPLDITRREALAELLAEIAESGAPLRGVYHAAGVLDDGILLQQSWERFERVLAPKVEGAWNLHVLTRELDLEQFVLFSSVASLLGSPGQGAYAAANAFLDALAHARRGVGLPAVSINWGPWAEGGMAENLSEQGKRQVEAQGIGLIRPREALEGLGAILQADLPQMGFVRFDARRLLAFDDRLAPFLSELGERPPRGPADDAEALDRNHLLAAAREGRPEPLADYLRERVAAVLHMGPAALDLDQTINRLGMDSLMIMELRNRLRSDLSVDLPMSVLLQFPTVRQMTELLTDHVAEAPPAAEPEDAEPAHLVEVQVDQLSDEEVEAMLRDLAETEA